MDMETSDLRASLRLSAGLMLAGQLAYIVVTLFHAGGDANDHHAVFATYARSGLWTAVHLGQFASMAVLLAGLYSLRFALRDEGRGPGLAGRLGAAAAVAALALYGVLQAVDGVALKQAVDAWATAPEADKAARFAAAEAIRWLEWGARSYHDFALGLSLLLFSVAVGHVAWARRPIGYLMALAGFAYLAQGWVVGAEGFSRAESGAIVLGFVMDVVWMAWLVVIAVRMPTAEAAPRRA
jgi:hypothetical protein